MLEAKYKDIKYTFNITTKDVSTIVSPFMVFLFRFTNDMTGDVKWSYGQNAVVRNRYTTVDFFHYVAEDMFTGRINFNPNGYWKYDVYQIPFYEGVPVLDECNAINPLAINWNIKNLASTLLDSGTFDLYDYKISGLTADKSPYNLNLYPGCPQAEILPATVLYKTQALNPERFVHVDKITQTPTGIVVDIYSTSPQRSFIEFTPTSGGNSITTPITTTTPYNISIFLPDLSSGLTGTNYDFKLYVDNALIDTYNTIVSETKPSGNTNNATVLFVNNDYETGWGGGTDLGSAFFTAQYLLFNVDVPEGTTFEDLKVEVGKLLVEETEGEEQVRYTQNEEPEGTNYIYNE
tara:strand:- start:1218 stop:2264 length:1047 start_codon:yes stop_codon:yes gene_type:complete